MCQGLGTVLLAHLPVVACHEACACPPCIRGRSLDSLLYQSMTATQPSGCCMLGGLLAEVGCVFMAHMGEQSCYLRHINPLHPCQRADAPIPTHPHRTPPSTNSKE